MAPAKTEKVVIAEPAWASGAVVDLPARPKKPLAACLANLLQDHNLLPFQSLFIGSSLGIGLLSGLDLWDKAPTAAPTVFHDAVNVVICLEIAWFALGVYCAFRRWHYERRQSRWEADRDIIFATLLLSKLPASWDSPDAGLLRLQARGISPPEPRLPDSRPTRRRIEF